jgi:PAS domain S-box-containing protein
MSKLRPKPTGREITFGEHEIIVSKTDLRGIITYSNPVFHRISGYTEEEVHGKPHNIIRHPDMPRSVFRLLWDTIESGQEIFAYVLNMASNGDGYWVFAHVTPSFNTKSKIIGFHSNRRVAHEDALKKVRPLYARMIAEERKHSTTDSQIAAGTAVLHAAIAQGHTTYGEFVFALSQHTNLEASIR